MRDSLDPSVRRFIPSSSVNPNKRVEPMQTSRILRTANHIERSRTAIFGDCKRGIENNGSHTMDLDRSSTGLEAIDRNCLMFCASPVVPCHDE